MKSFLSLKTFYMHISQQLNMRLIPEDEKK